jgi:bifunctional non-homologous end joining protein LigD
MVKRMPDFVAPQLCKLVDRPPGEPGWGHEVKLDGYRAQLRVQKHHAVIRTRTGLDWTDRFATIAADAKVLPDCVMDGEVIALDDKDMPSFAALQAALSNEDSQNLSFFAFDLLFAGREDLRALPLQDRKVRLQTLLSGSRISDRLHYVAHLSSDSRAIYASACKMNLEGIVSKKLDAPYRSGRSGDWTKAKCRAGQEVVIGGWTSEAGTVRSLLAGVYRNGKLNYVGRVGTGYGQRVAQDLSPRLEALTRASSPFSGDNAPSAAAKVRWLAPQLVAEIEFAGWTASGMIRQAAFKGLRQDKPAREVVAETPTRSAKNVSAAAGVTRVAAVTTAKAAKAAKASKAVTTSATPKAKKPAALKQPPTAAASTRIAATAVVMGVSISKPQKALWPGAGDSMPVTKLDLANYFEAVGDWMLPHLAGRPCSLVRVPDGLGAQQFFQRHAMAGQSALVSSVSVKGDKAPYLQIDRVEALAWVAQVGGLELHPWNCAPGDPEVAGRLVFDLDPAPDVKFDAVIAGALEIRDRLESLGLQSFCKTTGGKGLHVVTPLSGGRNAVAWPVAKNFAHIVCAQMVQDSPAKYLDNMAKKQRVGKIFLDYLRNDKTATAVAVLSPRAREGAPVSMPLHWQDIRAGLDPKAFTVRTAPKLLRQEKPWLGYAKAARSLSDAIRSVTGAVKATRASPRRR